MQTPVVICGYKRSPFHFATKGALAKVRPDDMGAAIVKALYDISVDVDFDEGVCTFAYFRTNNSPAYLQFVIRRVGPFTDMYEVFKQGKGRIARSGIFARAFEKLEEEIAELMPEQS